MKKNSEDYIMFCEKIQVCTIFHNVYAVNDMKGLVLELREVDAAAHNPRLYPNLYGMVSGCAKRGIKS